MRYLLLLMIILTGCQSGYTPSIIRAGTDVGITVLLNEKKLTVAKAKKLSLDLRNILDNKDVTVLLYNENVRMLLNKYPGSAVLAGQLLITVADIGNSKITPEYRYIVTQGLNQMDLAVAEWENWQKLKPKMD